MKYENRSGECLANAVKHARTYPLGSRPRESFLNCIRVLNKWKRDGTPLTIFGDFAPHSFTFQSFIYGGVIFHHASETWSIHT